MVALIEANLRRLYITPKGIQILPAPKILFKKNKKMQSHHRKHSILHFRHSIYCVQIYEET